jgi:hypothetical protein
MEDRILINPDNRMLASSGSNDFSLYGAPADPLFTIRQAEPEAASGPDPSGEQQTSTGSPGPGGAAPAVEAIVPVTPLREAQSPGSATTPSANPAPPPAADGPVSGGSLTPAATPVPAPTVMTLDGGTLEAPTLVTSTTSPPVADGLEAAPIRVTPARADDGESPEKAPLLSDVLETGPNTGLAELTAEIAPADALDPIVEGVEDLLGTDPAGGIATLVSLVSVSDVFDVSEAGSDIVQAGDPADLLDSLSADLPDLAPPVDDGSDEPAETLLGSASPPDPLGDVGDSLGGL